MAFNSQSKKFAMASGFTWYFSTRNISRYKFVFSVSGVSVKDDRLNYAILMEIFFCVQGNHFLYECIFWAELATWLEKFGDLLKFPDNVLEYKFVFAVNGVSVKDDRLNYVILMDNVYRNKL